MTSDEKKVDEAMNRLEELLIAGKQIVQDVRALPPVGPYRRRRAYARVYWLRRELGRVVATIGQGAPDLDQVAAHYERIIKD